MSDSNGIYASDLGIASLSSAFAAASSYLTYATAIDLIPRIAAQTSVIDTVGESVVGAGAIAILGGMALIGTYITADIAKSLVKEALSPSIK